MSYKIMGFIALSAFLISSSLAQSGPKLEINISEEKVNLSDEEKAGSVISYAPGDTIKYVLSSTNVGDAIMTDAVITDPIPAGVSYVLNSAKGQNSSILFSIDGGKQYGEWPVNYSFRNAQGIIVQKEASAEMVTHVRWEIRDELGVGAVNISTLKVVVIP